MQRISIDWIWPLLTAALFIGLASRAPAQGPPGDGPPPDVSVAGLIGEMGSPAAYVKPSAKPWRLESFGASAQAAPLRVVKRSGRSERVLAVASGPGAMVRFWCSRAEGMLKFFVDGGPEPALVLDLALVRDGHLQLWGGPMGQPADAGLIFRFPIPFAKSLEIRSDGRAFDWTMDVRRYEGGVVVLPFAKKSAAYQSFAVGEQLARLRGLLEARGPKKMIGTKVEHPRADFACDLAPGKEATILKRKSEKGGRLVELKFEEFLPFLERKVFKALFIIIDIDGKPAVHVPFRDFFFEGPEFEEGLEAWTRRELLFDGICRMRVAGWPIAYRESIRIRIKNQGSQPAKGLRFDFVHGELPEPSLPLRFEGYHYDHDLVFHRAASRLPILPVTSGRSELLADIMRSAPGPWNRGAPYLTNADGIPSRPGGPLTHYCAATRPAQEIRTLDTLCRTSGDEQVFGRQRLLDRMVAKPGQGLRLDIGWDGAESRRVSGSVFCLVEPAK